MSCPSSELVGVIFAAFMICTFSSKARYYFKMIVFLMGSMLLVLPLTPVMMLRPRDYRNALLPAYGCVKLGKLLGVEFELRGLENLDKKKGAVVLINHQSGLDLIVLAVLWPILGRSTVVAKKEVFYLLPFGIPCWLWGTLFIKRTNQENARNAINKEGQAIQEKQAKLIFFPEGTRNQGEHLLKFKKGSFHTAMQAQCPIIPVVVSRYHFLDSIKKRFGRGKNIIQILPEIATYGLKRDNLDSLVSNTRNIMQAEFHTISEESRRINSKLKF